MSGAVCWVSKNLNLCSTYFVNHHLLQIWGTQKTATMHAYMARYAEHFKYEYDYSNVVFVYKVRYVKH